MAREEKQNLDRLAAVVRESLGRMVRRLRRERSDDLSLFKLIILASISRLGPTTATELATREHIRPQSLTRLLSFFEDRGFVDRQPDERDKRRNLISVTVDGVEALQTNTRKMEGWLASVMGQRLSPAECDDLRHACRLLDRLAEDGGEQVAEESP